MKIDQLTQWFGMLKTLIKVPLSVWSLAPGKLYYSKTKPNVCLSGAKKWQKYKSSVFALSQWWSLFQAARISWVIPASSISQLSEIIYAFGRRGGGGWEKLECYRNVQLCPLIWWIGLKEIEGCFEDSEEDIIFLWERVGLLAFLWASLERNFEILLSSSFV